MFKFTESLRSQSVTLKDDRGKHRKYQSQFMAKIQNEIAKSKWNK